MAKYPKYIHEVAGILQKTYKDYSHKNKKRPLDELLFILCSVKTDERKYQQTYLALKKNFPRYTMLLEASIDSIAKAIHNGGLSNQKAKMIKQIFSVLNDQFNKPTLAPLKGMNDSDCEGFLTSLPGVGKKVARCIMMYSFERQVFPVDTHCWRIFQRLGWIQPKTSDKSCRQKEMDRVQDRVPPELRYSLHVNMVSLGREICTASNPHCQNCFVSSYCKKIGVSKRTKKISKA